MERDILATAMAWFAGRGDAISTKSERMTADLVCPALNMALTWREPPDVIHHGDQSGQYYLPRLQRVLSSDRRAGLDGRRWRYLSQRSGRDQRATKPCSMLSKCEAC